MQKDFHFIHIPKTGGQAILAALGQGLSRHKPCFLPEEFQSANNSKFTFAFVRNPFDRAVSLFYWFAQLHLHIGRKRMPENAALNQWARNTNVNDFWLNVDVDYLNFQTKANMFRQQFWFVSANGYSVFERINIFKFESINESWEEISQKVGASTRLTKRNTSDHGSYESELNEASKARIRDLYSEDFQQFYPNI